MAAVTGKWMAHALILNERSINGQRAKSKTAAEKQVLVPRKQNFLISSLDDTNYQMFGKTRSF